MARERGSTKQRGRSRGAGSSERGFAAMDEEKQREIASKGGQAAHEAGTAHEFTPEEAAEAGRKGGEAAQEAGTAHKFTPEEREEGGRKGGETVSQDREHMAEIGRKGGESRGHQRSRSGSAQRMTRRKKTRGGTPEQHAKAGQQSHKSR